MKTGDVFNYLFSLSFFFFLRFPWKKGASKAFSQIRKGVGYFQVGCCYSNGTTRYHHSTLKKLKKWIFSEITTSIRLYNQHSLNFFSSTCTPQFYSGGLSVRKNNFKQCYRVWPFLEIIAATSPICTLFRFLARTGQGRGTPTNICAYRIYLKVNLTLLFYQYARHPLDNVHSHKYIVNQFRKRLRTYILVYIIVEGKKVRKHVLFKV